MEPTNPRIQYRCSFCGKSQEQIHRLIAGPGGVYICNECLDLCNEIVAEERQSMPRVRASKSRESVVRHTVKWDDRQGDLESRIQDIVERIEQDTVEAEALAELLQIALGLMAMQGLMHTELKMILERIQSIEEYLEIRDATD